jgi:hypothetical protein
VSPGKQTTPTTYGLRRSLPANAAGKGTLKVDAIVGEAFASFVAGNPPARNRAELDYLVIWFTDPAQVPAPDPRPCPRKGRRGSSCFANISKPRSGLAFFDAERSRPLRGLRPRTQRAVTETGGLVGHTGARSNRETPEGARSGR